MTKWVLGHRITTHEVTGDYDMVFGETPSNTDGPPPHHHNFYHEVFIITEGSMEFIVNGETNTLRKGDTINIPPQSIHTFSNTSEEPCKWINIHSPKGFLRFFDSLGIPEDEQNARKNSLAPGIIQKVIETAPKYDMIIKH